MSAVIAVCERHRETWKELPAFGAAMKELGSSMDSIQALLLARQSLVAGLAARKQQIRDEAGGAALEAAGALRALAEATGDAELAGLMAIGRTDLFAGRANTNAERAELIYSAAQKRAGALADFGLTPAKRARLRERLDAFQAVIRESHENVAVRRGTSARLRVEVSGAERLLTRLLDGLVLQFRESDPLFVEEYLGARKLVKRSATRGEPPAPDVENKSAA